MKERERLSHYKIELGKLVPKKSYETEKEALFVARKINIMDKTIHKMVAYKCYKCGKWHIGKNTTELTKEDKEHIKEILRREKKYGF